MRMLQKVIRNQVEWQYLKAQYDQLFDEWTVTTQRVNLFEKVKIPDAQEHIRRIRIFLGDQQTAGVARAKLAKAKMATRGQRT
ncbi:MAG: V/A-type H+-transporting ATPase subunit D [Verrucomicrobiales bacterium]